MGITIQIKRSDATATPTSLAVGELAYSSLSDNLFIGEAGAVVTKIGGNSDVLKLAGIEANANNYIHPTSDGNLHVPATSTTNDGKVLTAGATEGALSWTTPTVGTVTSVTGTSPVVSSGGATPDISMPAATNAIAGHATAAHIAAIEANTAKVTNATHTGDAIGSTALTVVKINGTQMSSLATGILKNTTGTGVPSIAVASDFPILNQSTTGNAATATTLQTNRTINGINFNGSANITINAVDSTSRIAVTEKGVASGVCPLDTDSRVPSTYLPSYVNDVIEFDNLTAFPVTGETGKIYVAADTNKTYRWGGSAYVYITSGAVDSVAGKSGVITLVKADVGLGSVDNTTDANKPVSTAQQTALDLKANTSDIYAKTEFMNADLSALII